MASLCSNPGVVLADIGWDVLTYPADHVALTNYKNFLRHYERVKGITAVTPRPLWDALN